MQAAKKYLIFLFCVSIGYNVLAQHLPFINYNTHKGLPQIQVQQLCQDERGYIWVGTKGGLAKFNGERFERFLENKYIYGVGIVSPNNLYFLTIDSLYKEQRGRPVGIAASEDCYKMATGKEGLWVYNENMIKEYRSDTLFHTIHRNIYTEAGFKSAQYDPSQNRLLISTKDGHVYALKDKKVKWLALYDSPVEIERKNCQYPYGLIKVAPNEFEIINPDTREVYLKYKIDRSLYDLEIFRLPEKRFFLSSFHTKECFWIDSLTHHVQKIDLPFEEEHYPFLIDKDNNYWVGTDNGLYQIRSNGFKAFPKRYMNNTWTMIKGKDDTFYAAQYKIGLFRLDLKNLKKTEIPVKGIDIPFENSFYYGSSKDARGNLYFPTHNGLVKYDYHTAKIFDTGVSIITKYDSVRDEVIFGQYHGIGFIDKNEHIEICYDSLEETVTFHPHSLEIMPNDKIWIGNRTGLVVFDRINKTFTPMKQLYNHCPQQQIVSMTKDYKNNVWLGGKSELWLFDRVKNTFEHVGKEFFKRKILAIISPTPQLLIIGTSSELVAMNLDVFYRDGTVEYKVFNYRNGFFSEEVAQNGFLLDGDYIYIPSSTTLSILNYKELDINPEYFNVFVTSINKVCLCEKELTRQKEFVVSKGVNRLNIRFESVGFGLPTYSQFRYKLEGVDQTWSAWSRDTEAHYANLSSGKYSFRVAAKSGSHNRSALEKECIVDIVIQMPFYNEPGFFKYSLVVFFLLIVLTLAFVWRAYKNKLEVQERERQVKFMEIAALQAQINPHFIFNFLSSMQSLISREERGKANEYLVKFSRLMRAYMESSIKSTQLLLGSVLENENTVKEEIELLMTYIELESLKYPNGKIKYSIDIDDPSILNKTMPPLLLQPFVENAIKHGILPKDGDGNIQIQFRCESDKLICRIADDGIGRRRSELNKANSIRANKSRGMQLILDRVKMLNELEYHITITFEDPDEGGTIVIITIQN